MTETELIRGLKRRDENAYRVIVDQYQATVLNCCFKFVKNRETAEDLTQDVFMEVYRSIHMFRSESKLSTWLLRIAITKSLDYAKRAKRQKRVGFLKRILPGESGEESHLTSNLSSPQQILENEDRIRVLTWALDSLPENQKVAFTLSKHEELSYNEIADILGTTVSAVESLIVRAKTNLKKKLYGYYRKHL